MTFGVWGDVMGSLTYSLMLREAEHFRCSFFLLRNRRRQIEAATIDRSVEGMYSVVMVWMDPRSDIITEFC